MASQIPNNRTSEFQKIIDSAEQGIGEVEVSPFSSGAFDILKKRVGEYTVQLVSESIKVSQRHRSDTVSINDVDRASQYLFSSSSNKLFRNIGTIGGIFLGAGLSTMLSMVVENKYSTTPVILAVILILLGTFMVALQIARD